MSHTTGRENDDSFRTERLRGELGYLLSFGPRSQNDAEATKRTIAYLTDNLSAMGYRVRVEPFGEQIGERNIIVECPEASPKSPVLEIAAHYDTVPGSTGADDNGSGVIGLVALARHFANSEFRCGIRFCFFGCEETGLRGSRAHQQSLAKESRPFGGCLVFEMIGFRNRAANSQRTPVRVPFLLSPPRIGDFLAVVSNWSSRFLAKRYQQAAMAQVPDLAIYNVNIPSCVLKDSMRSDHAPYWQARRPALMLTDTANFRNPHYHAPSDTLETIDFGFMARIARATAATAEAWARRQAPPDR